MIRRASAILFAMVVGIVFVAPVAGKERTFMVVRINDGVETASINTALDRSIISASLAQSLGIKASEKGTVTDGMLGPHDGLRASNIKVSLNGVPLAGLDVVVLSDEQVRRLVRGAAANFSLGANVFDHRIVEITYPSGKLTVVNRAQSCGRGAHVIQFIMSNTGTAMPVVDITVDGMATKALIDPAVDEPLILSANSKQHFDKEVHLKVGSHRTVTRPVRRTDTPGLGIIPFVIGARAFGSAVLTVDSVNGKLCILQRGT